MSVSPTLPTTTSNSTLPAVVTTSNSTLPVAPSTAPVTVPTTTSTSTADPVAVAADKIFKFEDSAVAKLWEKEVTNASNIFTKFVGLFVYRWNKGAAVEQDKTFSTTVENINKAVTELVDAVAARGFTDEESASLRLAPVKHTKTNAQLIAGQNQLAAKEKLEAFYALFKERVVTQLGIAENSDAFGVYAAAATKAIQDNANGVKAHITKTRFLKPNTITQVPATMAPRIATTLKDFNSKIFFDMVNSFADQPFENITIQGFKDTAKVIKGFFNHNDTVEIEAQLRQAIKAKHDSAQINTIRGEFLSPAADAPRYVAARDALKAKLDAEKTDLETELNAYRGPSGTDGSYNTAVQAKNEAEGQKNIAFTALVAAFRSPAASVNENDVNETLNAIITFLGGATTSTSSSVAQIQGLLTDYQQKAADFEAKKLAFDTLKARFDEIAAYSAPNVLSGGKLHAINTNLQAANLDAAARAEATKIANFYNELNQVVGENNKAARSTALHAIIG